MTRGAYLAAAAGCDQCHTDAKHGGKPFAGGRVFDTGAGLVISPNITSDPATGIGRWRFADFARALRWGIAPDDTHYLPVFPFAFYNGLTERDLADLWAFLGGVAPVRQGNRAGSGSPLGIDRVRGAIGVAAWPLAGRWRPDPKHSGEWNRGAYLVATIGRCGYCHTPRTALGVPDGRRLLAGNPSGPDGKKVPDITPDSDTGIGGWSVDDITTLLATGETPDLDHIGGAMREIVRNTARMTAADRQAIAVYLRSLPVSGRARPR